MGAMSIIYGQSNCGKTFWVQDLVKHVIAGIPWRGQAVDRGAVLYLALEGGRQAFNNRIFALKQEMGWEGHDLPLAFITVPINLLNPDADVRPDRYRYRRRQTLRRGRLPGPLDRHRYPLARPGRRQRELI